MTALLPSKHKSTKKFFWAITSQTESFLAGYLHDIFNGKACPDSIKLLIAKFSCNIFIDSKILKFNEIDLFLSLLSNQWNNNKLHFKLLHRGSDHMFDINKLNTEILEIYQEYIVIIETNHGNVFGIYNNFNRENGFQNGYSKTQLVHFGFEFVIRSQNHYLPKVFLPNKSASFYYRSTSYGPDFDDDYVFIRSKNCCIALARNNILNTNSICVGWTSFNANKLCGGIDSTHFMNHQAFKFKVIEYEVFEVVSKCTNNIEQNKGIKNTDFIY